MSVIVGHFVAQFVAGGDGCKGLAALSAGDKVHGITYRA